MNTENSHLITSLLKVEKIVFSKSVMGESSFFLSCENFDVETKAFAGVNLFDRFHATITLDFRIQISNPLMFNVHNENLNNYCLLDVQ